jgi:hypothetical protein
VSDTTDLGERAALGMDSLGRHLRSYDPADPGGARSLAEAYEYLAADPARWQDVLLAEVDRVLQACEREPLNRAPYRAAVAFSSLAGKGAAALESGIRMRLLPRLGMSVVQVRRLCADLLADFVHPGDRAALDALTRLLEDRDFRVRHFAFLALEAKRALPSGYRPSLADQVLKRLIDWNDYV